MSLDIEWVSTRLPGRRVVWFEIAASTMTEAARLAGAGCASGTLVVADQQVSGYGRYGRTWHSERESGLYVSFVLRLPRTERYIPVLALALGLATAEAISRNTNLGCDLRWPNDVLIGGRKAAGILVQLEEAAFITGIGINVNHTLFPPELEGVATSLRIASGLVQSRERLLVELAGAVDSFVKMLIEGGREPILRMFARASSYVRGKRVIVDRGDNVIEGITDGLDSDGFLFVRRSGGERTLVLAGGVRPAPED